MPSEYSPVAGGACAPVGFVSNAVSCGIKNPDSPKLDLAIIASEFPCVASGTFTRNRVVAAPVRVSKNHLRRRKLRPQAIVANSGNANACTGARGIDDASQLAAETAAQLGLKENQILVGSTGIIGLPMPMSRITPRVGDVVAGLQGEHSDLAAEAIMTSDTKPKQYSIEFELGKRMVRIGGIAKGAGMIRPDMATMFAFITTDVNVSEEELQRATREAVDDSFNCITIDGDMSTNDTVFVLANGQAGNKPYRPGGKNSKLFRAALKHVMLKLARMMVRDGERVTKFVEVCVCGALSRSDARKAAEAVANSNLVKSSWNGNDPNWGRVIHAVGYSGARIDESRIDIYFDGLCACRNGLTTDTDLAAQVEVVSKREFRICIDLNRGDCQHIVYASDLSPEYVDYNRSEYSVARAKQLQG